MCTHEVCESELIIVTPYWSPRKIKRCLYAQKIERCFLKVNCVCLLHSGASQLNMKLVSFNVQLSTMYSTVPCIASLCLKNFSLCVCARARARVCVCVCVYVCMCARDFTTIAIFSNRCCHLRGLECSSPNNQSDSCLCLCFLNHLTS